MKSRSYELTDYSQVMAFLGRLYQLNPGEPYWLPSRWEYAEHLVSPLFLSRGYPHWHRSIRLWTTGDGDIVAVVNSENPDENAFLHVHPDYRHLEPELVEWAEQNIATARPGGGRRLRVWAVQGDSTREQLLAGRGYVQLEDIEYLKWQRLDGQLFRPVLPPGYSASSLAEGMDAARRHECTGRAFGSKPLTDDIYRVTQSAPTYRADLDLGIVDEDGQVCSVCTVWLDEPNGLGDFEPVATHPEYQRRGLGKAVLTEGLRRLQALGAQLGYVGAYGEERSAFYSSAGFVDSVAFRRWERLLDVDQAGPQ